MLSESLAAGERGWLRGAVQLDPLGCVACCRRGLAIFQRRFANPRARCMGEVMGRLPLTSPKEGTHQDKHSVKPLVLHVG